MPQKGEKLGNNVHADGRGPQSERNELVCITIDHLPPAQGADMQGPSFPRHCAVETEGAFEACT